ncbi:MAG: helix-turn-helix transcriptional regulator [Candidatus Lustribacter sp.]
MPEAPADPELRRLARAVVKQRKAAGLTQERLAELAGISGRHVQALEAARLNPSYKVLLALARAMGVPLSDLV